MVRANHNGKHSHRMLKKPRLLTHPTLARRGAPCPSKAAISVCLLPLLRGGWDDPNCARPTRASEAARCASTGIVLATPTSFFSILLDCGLPLSRTLW